MLPAGHLEEYGGGSLQPGRQGQQMAGQVCSLGWHFLGQLQGNHSSEIGSDLKVTLSKEAEPLNNLRRLPPLEGSWG